MGRSSTTSCSFFVMEIQWNFLCWRTSVISLCPICTGRWLRLWRCGCKLSATPFILRYVIRKSFESLMASKTMNQMSWTRRHNNLTDKEVLMMKMNCCVSTYKQRDVFDGPKKNYRDVRKKMYVELKILKFNKTTELHEINIKSKNTERRHSDCRWKNQKRNNEQPKV